MSWSVLIDYLRNGQSLNQAFLLPFSDEETEAGIELIFKPKSSELFSVTFTICFNFKKKRVQIERQQLKSIE